MDLKFDPQGLIPAIIQDGASGEVLMLGYMSEESLAMTLQTGRTWFWSRSRREFWCKGETSGHRQYVREIRYDCDGDALLIKVHQVGPACHTGERSCFFRVIPEALTDLEPGD
jgi:phosphoribosyl-AMP cyclohydrolase